jgi:hypothetical protein
LRTNLAGLIVSTGPSQPQQSVPFTPYRGRGRGGPQNQFSGPRGGRGRGGGGIGIGSPSRGGAIAGGSGRSMAAATLSSLLQSTRPLLKPIAFVRSAHTKVLFADEEVEEDELLHETADSVLREAGVYLNHVRP